MAHLAMRGALISSQLAAAARTASARRLTQICRVSLSWGPAHNCRLRCPGAGQRCCALTAAAVVPLLQQLPGLRARRYDGRQQLLSSPTRCLSTAALPMPASGLDDAEPAPLAAAAAAVAASASSSGRLAALLQEPSSFATGPEVLDSIVKIFTVRPENSCGRRLTIS
jgi:hypothetical protein